MLGCTQTPEGHFREVQNVSHHSLKCPLRPLQVASFQPRPQGFSLKKMGGPNQFLRERHWGRGWLPPLSVCVHFRQDFALKWPVSFNLL